MKTQVLFAWASKPALFGAVCLVLAGSLTQRLQAQTITDAAMSKIQGVAQVRCEPSTQTIIAAPGQNQIKLEVPGCYCAETAEALKNSINALMEGQQLFDQQDMSYQMTMTISGDISQAETRYCYTVQTIDNLIAELKNKK